MSGSGCVDLKGTPIPEGHPFSPGPDGCLLCVCSLGRPILCRSALCAPPKNCRASSRLEGETCCQFYCLDPELDPGNGQLGLRLVASGITAILSLALLFFLIYRLRQRKRGEDSPGRMELEGEEDGPPPLWDRYASSWWWKPSDAALPPPPSYDESVYLDPPPAYSEADFDPQNTLGTHL